MSINTEILAKLDSNRGYNTTKTLLEFRGIYCTCNASKVGTEIALESSENAFKTCSIKPT